MLHMTLHLSVNMKTLFAQKSYSESLDEKKNVFPTLFHHISGQIMCLSDNVDNKYLFIGISSISTVAIVSSVSQHGGSSTSYSVTYCVSIGYHDKSLLSLQETHQYVEANSLHHPFQL